MVYKLYYCYIDIYVVIINVSDFSIATMHAKVVSCNNSAYNTNVVIYNSVYISCHSKWCIQKLTTAIVSI